MILLQSNRLIDERRLLASANDMLPLAVTIDDALPVSIVIHGDGRIEVRSHSQIMLEPTVSNSIIIHTRKES